MPTGVQGFLSIDPNTGVVTYPPRLNPLIPYAVGLLDATAALNSALVEGIWDIPDGEYVVNGVVQKPYNRSIIGRGSGRVRFKLGAAGQIRCGYRATVADPAQPGGTVRGFTVDGLSTSNLGDGGLYIGTEAYVTFDDVKVRDCYGDCTVIEGAQNCVFIGFFSAQSVAGNCLVLDYGCGGLTFIQPQIAIPGPGKSHVVYRQTGVAANPSQYPALFGPSVILILHPQIEFTSGTPAAVIDHTAGRRNVITGGGIGVIGVASPFPLIRLRHGCDAIQLTGTADGTTTVTGVTPNPITAGVVAGMAAKPSTGPLVFVNSTTANTVTFGGPVPAGAGITVGVGAGISELTLENVNLEGTPSITTLCEMDGNCTLTLRGKCEGYGAAVGFRTRATDILRLDERVLLSAVDTVWQQVAGDTPAVTLNDVLASDYFPWPNGVNKLRNLAGGASFDVEGTSLARLTMFTSDSAADRKRTQIVKDGATGLFYVAFQSDDQLSQQVPLQIRRGTGINIAGIDLNGAVNLANGPYSLGVFGGAGAGQLALPAAAVDLATALALVNQIRSNMISWGFSV